MQDLLGSATRVLSDDTLYRCLDKLLAHKRAFFSFLRQRWEVLFQARFDILLYDLTSTYFESDPPFAGKRQFGYSRDKRPDCVQVVIALVVTPQGFPLAYEVMPGNTSDKTTLKDFLQQIEAQYGRSDRVWIMDRGIPTEETLEQMRTAQPPVHYLVGTPKGRLSKFERKFLNLPWQAVRPSVDVKLLAHDKELYILARSHPSPLLAQGLDDHRWQALGDSLQGLGNPATDAGAPLRHDLTVLGQQAPKSVDLRRAKLHQLCAHAVQRLLVLPIFSAIDSIAARCESCADWCFSTMRTARARTLNA